MSDRCPASPEVISSVTRGLEKAKPDTDQLQNLFVNDSVGVLTKEQRQECLRAIAAQNISDKNEQGKAILAQLGPHATAHDLQIAGAQIKPEQILPTFQLSLGFDDKLIRHRPNLNAGENSPNGVWETPYADYRDADGRQILQFGDKKVPIVSLE